MAFVPCRVSFRAPAQQRSSALPSCPRMSSSDVPAAHLSRRAALKTSLGFVAAAAATALSTAASPPAAHASVTGSISKTFFPKEGFQTPDALAPGKVAVDAEALAAKDVQDSVKKLRAIREVMGSLAANFKADAQMEVVPVVRKNIEISSLRTALNTANRIFDEDTQRETDSVVRNIIQDITELENYAVLKDGKPRTPRRIEKTTLWLEKLNKDFDKLLAFFP